MLDRSPLTVARKEIKSFRADRLPILPIKSVNNIILGMSGDCCGRPCSAQGKERSRQRLLVFQDRACGQCVWLRPYILEQIDMINRCPTS